MWKEEDVLGAIGVRTEDGIDAVIQHISVNPSHRNSGIGKKMINEIHRLYQNKYVVSTTDEIEDFYNKCLDVEDPATSADDQ